MSKLEVLLMLYKRLSQEKGKTEMESLRLSLCDNMRFASCSVLFLLISPQQNLNNHYYIFTVATTRHGREITVKKKNHLKNHYPENA